MDIFVKKRGPPVIALNWLFYPAVSLLPGGRYCSLTSQSKPTRVFGCPKNVKVEHISPFSSLWDLRLVRQWIRAMLRRKAKKTVLYWDVGRNCPAMFFITFWWNFQTQWRSEDGVGCPLTVGWLLSFSSGGSPLCWISLVSMSYIHRDGRCRIHQVATDIKHGF